MDFEESGLVMWKMCWESWRLGCLVYSGSPILTDMGCRNWAIVVVER